MTIEAFLVVERRAFFVPLYIQFLPEVDNIVVTNDVCKII